MLFYNYKSKYSVDTKLNLIFASIIFYTIIYYLFDDHHFSDEETFSKNKQERITSRIYISTIIQSAIGLGHVFPTSNTMRCIISSQALTTLIIALM